MKRDECLFWFSFDTGDGDGQWDVYLATWRGAPCLKDGVGRDGYTFFESREIFISVHQTREQEDMTVYHEQHHAKINRQGNFHHRTEESLVCKLEVASYHAAKSMGWKLPRRPRGYGRLKRVAESMEWHER